MRISQSTAFTRSGLLFGIFVPLEGVLKPIRLAKRARNSLYLRLAASVLGLLFGLSSPASASAPWQSRQYYSSWSYQPRQQYYARRFYYKPTRTHSGYNYHYAVYYPKRYSSRPRYSRYVYYYNPVRRVYWGRFDLEGEPGKQYSLLKDEDRKGNLDEIPESAFPDPGQMPVLPDSKDNIRIKPIDRRNLPVESAPEDLPAGATKKS